MCLLCTLQSKNQGDVLKWLSEQKCPGKSQHWSSMPEATTIVVKIDQSRQVIGFLTIGIAKSLLIVVKDLCLQATQTVRVALSYGCTTGQPLYDSIPGDLGDLRYWCIVHLLLKESVVKGMLACWGAHLNIVVKDQGTVIGLNITLYCRTLYYFFKYK